MKVKYKNNQSIVNSVLNSEVNEMSDGTMSSGRGASIMAQKHVGRIGKGERKISWEMEEASAFRLANINRERKQPPIPLYDNGKKLRYIGWRLVETQARTYICGPSAAINVNRTFP